MRQYHVLAILPLLAIILVGCGRNTSTPEARRITKMRAGTAQVNEAQVLLKVEGMV